MFGVVLKRKSGNDIMIVNDGVVVIAHSPHRCSPGSNPWRTHFHSVFLQQHWRVETMGSGVTRLCDGDVSCLLWNWAGWGCGKMELVSVCCGLLRMGGEYLLPPVWRPGMIGYYRGLWYG